MPSQPFICVPKKTKSPSFSQNSTGLPRNSVSSLFRNSTLERVVRPFLPWTGMSCFSNRALVKAIFEASKCLTCGVFEASKSVSTKTLLWKHDYRRQVPSCVELSLLDPEDQEWKNWSGPLYKGLKAKCSKSRDLTAIAICDSNRESQITSHLRQCEPSQKSSLFWLVVWEIGIAILTAIWTEVQITNRAIWKCDLSWLRLRLGGEILAIWTPRFQITSDLRFVIWST